MTKYHEQGYKEEKSVPHSSEGRKSKVKVVSGEEGPLPGSSW
jgi:hypothetical protein